MIWVRWDVPALLVMVYTGKPTFVYPEATVKSNYVETNLVKPKTLYLLFESLDNLGNRPDNPYYTIMYFSPLRHWWHSILYTVILFKRKVFSLDP